MSDSVSLDGLLLIDKPADLTSHDVVAKVRKTLKQKSVGHTGTLDPFATGLMIMVLGEATKLSDYLVAEDKSYHVKIRTGMVTDTLDRTGKVLSESNKVLNADEIRSACHSLEGDFKWPVPMVSAMKIQGKKLLEYARSGEAVEVPEKLMRFWGVTIEKVDSMGVELVLSCSKGSFIRSWASKLGEVLGTGAVVEELRRLKVGSWDLASSVGLGVLEELAGTEGPLEVKLGSAFVPMSQALPGLKSLVANDKEVRLLSNGQIPKDMVNRLIFEQKQAHAKGQPEMMKVLTTSGQLLAILAAEPGQGLKIRRVFRVYP